MKVDLSERALTEVPWSEIPTDVTGLDLTNNQLTRLRRPPEIGQLTKLRRLELRNNPIKILPNSVVINPGEEAYYAGFIRLPKWSQHVDIYL